MDNRLSYDSPALTTISEQRNCSPTCCASAAIPFHQQEGSSVVSSEEEASKDCVDNCIQKAAQKGQQYQLSLTAQPKYTQRQLPSLLSVAWTS